MPGVPQLRWRACLGLLLLLLLSACASKPVAENAPAERSEQSSSDEALIPSSYLFRAATTIQDEWFHMRMRGQTEYQLTIFDKAVAIRARGQDSASGLIRAVDIDLQACPEIEWTWAATQVQRSVNLYDKNGEDVAASLFLLFGDPGLYSEPDPVPTLRYVWTTDHVQQGEVIDNPYLSGLVKSIAVRVTPTEAGLTQSGSSWLLERRNILEDFERAFGHFPEEGLQAIAIFSDNDQTNEPVEAYYGWARMYCASEAAGSGDETDTW